MGLCIPSSVNEKLLSRAQLITAESLAELVSVAAFRSGFRLAQEGGAPCHLGWYEEHAPAVADAFKAGHAVGLAS